MADLRPGASVYDAIAPLYDDWSRTVTEDVELYVAEAVASGGPVLELGVGTGRIAVPTALAGIRVIGIDSSAAMLEVCRSAAVAHGVESLVDLRLGDLRRPVLAERVPLVTCPFRSLLHLLLDDERLATFERVFGLLRPRGRFVFDVFAPSAGDIRETNGRWIERGAGILERADWYPDERRLDLSVCGPDGETTMRLAWLPTEAWRPLLERAGFTDVHCYGWFDRRPYRGGEDSLWFATRPG